MNSWKFNSRASHILIKKLSRELKVKYTDIYKEIAGFNYPDGTIITKDGKEYELILKEKK